MSPPQGSPKERFAGYCPEDSCRKMVSVAENRIVPRHKPRVRAMVRGSMDDQDYCPGSGKVAR